MGIKTAIVTGSSGLVGSEAVRTLLGQGWDVMGFDNNMRKHFFGDDGSVADVTRHQIKNYDNFRSYNIDIRSRTDVETLIHEHRESIKLIIHTAAQPSHDWAAKYPHIDFGVNALGTHNLLEAFRRFTRDAVFCHISTSKVYGDRPNDLPLEDFGSRLDLEKGHRYHNGIDTTMAVDKCLHSLFGVSKLSGDLLVQEYGRYFNLSTVCFRPGCVTGAGHQGAELHGFLSYLMKCIKEDREYNIFGYDGKQVRCNINSQDLVEACLVYANDPKPGEGKVYNIGGGRHSACSVKEAIEIGQDLTGRKLRTRYVDQARRGDHQWWISDNSEFQGDYKWNPTYKLPATLNQIYQNL